MGFGLIGGEGCMWFLVFCFVFFLLYCRKGYFLVDDNGDLSIW